MRVDPNKLVSYGLNIGQVEQQLTNNNINAGGNFVETGLQQMNVRTIGLFTQRERHRADGPDDEIRDAASGQRHRRGERRARKSDWATRARPSIARTA